MANKIPYIRSIFPDAKFIHAVRDVIPFAGSWKRALDDETKDVVFYWPEGDGMNCWFLPFSRDPWGRSRGEMFAEQDRFYPGGGFARFAEYWTAVNKEILAECENLPDSILMVRYEDLCFDLKGELRKIFDFLGLPPEVGHLEPVASANEKSAGNLSEEEKRTCLSIAGELARRLGY